MENKYAIDTSFPFSLLSHMLVLLRLHQVDAKAVEDGLLESISDDSDTDADPNNVRHGLARLQKMNVSSLYRCIV